MTSEETKTEKMAAPRGGKLLEGELGYGLPDETDDARLYKQLKEALLIQTPLQVLLESLFTRVTMQARLLAKHAARFEMMDEAAELLDQQETHTRLRILEDQMHELTGGKLSPFRQVDILDRIDSLESAVAKTKDIASEAARAAVRANEPRLAMIERRLQGVNNLAGNVIAVNDIADELGYEVPNLEYDGSIERAPSSRLDETQLLMLDKHRSMQRATAESLVSSGDPPPLRSREPSARSVTIDESRPMSSRGRPASGRVHGLTIMQQKMKAAQASIAAVEDRTSVLEGGKAELLSAVEDASVNSAARMKQFTEEANVKQEKLSRDIADLYGRLPEGGGFSELVKVKDDMGQLATRVDGQEEAIATLRDERVTEVEKKVTEVARVVEESRGAAVMEAVKKDIVQTRDEVKAVDQKIDRVAEAVVGGDPSLVGVAKESELRELVGLVSKKADKRTIQRAIKAAVEGSVQAYYEMLNEHAERLTSVPGPGLYKGRCIACGSDVDVPKPPSPAPGTSIAAARTLPRLQSFAQSPSFGPPSVSSAAGAGLSPSSSRPISAAASATPKGPGLNPERQRLQYGAAGSRPGTAPGTPLGAWSPANSRPGSPGQPAFGGLGAADTLPPNLGLPPGALGAPSLEPNNMLTGSPKQLSTARPRVAFSGRSQGSMASKLGPIEDVDEEEFSDYANITEEADDGGVMRTTISIRKKPTVRAGSMRAKTPVFS